MLLQAHLATKIESMHVQSLHDTAVSEFQVTLESERQSWATERDTLQTSLEDAREEANTARLQVAAMELHLSRVTAVSRFQGFVVQSSAADSRFAICQPLQGKTIRAASSQGQDTIGIAGV